MCTEPALFGLNTVSVIFVPANFNVADRAGYSDKY